MKKSIFPFFSRVIFILVLVFSMPQIFRAAIPQKKLLLRFYSSASPVRYADLYDSLNLDSLGLSRQAYQEAIQGYKKLEQQGSIQNAGIISIVDLSQPSFKKRLFILDIEKGILLFNTLVAHGRNSGQVLATRFSNRMKSYQSSLGFYITSDTYRGHKGWALRLMGMEKGINNNASSRGIVVHAARYVDEDIAAQYHRVGRSEGCPAIPVNMILPVIEKIKNGSCFFIYGIDRFYPVRSALLRSAALS